MTTLFPGGLDNFVNPTPANSLSDVIVLHSDEHSNVNDAIHAIESWIGISGSLVPATIEYRLNHVAGGASGLGVVVWSSGTYIATGTILNFVGAGVFVSASGTVIEIDFSSMVGPAGPQGPTGSQGPQGPQGIQGPTGSQGPQGIQGPTGSQGPQGIQGPTGSQGPQGIQGPTGSQGPQGIQGPSGSPGINGLNFIGLMGQDDGVPIGTGTTMNARGFSVLTISGTVLDLFITGSGKALLTSDATYYISPTGNDNNLGTAISPWLTIQHAVDWTSQNINANGHAVTIQLATGTYPLSGQVNFKDIEGVQFPTVIGDEQHPENFVVTVSGSGYAFSSYAISNKWFVDGIKVKNVSKVPAQGVLLATYTALNFYNGIVDGPFYNVFGADSNADVFVGGTLKLLGVSGTALGRVVTNAWMSFQPVPLFISGASYYATAVFVVNDNSFVQYSPSQVSGTVTGQQFQVQHNSNITNYAYPNPYLGTISGTAQWDSLAFNFNDQSTVDMGRGDMFRDTYDVNHLGIILAHMPGQNNGVPLGTGTTFNVNGSRLVLSLSGTVFNLTNSPEPIDNIGIMSQNQGVPLATGTTLNVRGTRLVATVSGTVVDLTNSPDPIDNIGIMTQHLGVNLGTGSTFNVVGSITVSGSVTQFRNIKTYPLAMAVIPGPATYSSLPAVDTNIAIIPADLVGYTQANLRAQFGTAGTANSSGTILHLKYSITGAGGIELALNTPSTGQVRWISGTIQESGWFDMATGAYSNDPRFFRLILNVTGGNGAASPNYWSIAVDFR